MSRNLVFIVAALVVAISSLAGVLYFTQKPALHGSVISPLRPAPQIALTDAVGRPFDLGALRGNVVLIYFGYTRCPDVCPLTMANLTRTMDILGPDARRTRVVMITTDPVRDTRGRLAEFLGTFDPAFVGVTDSPERLEGVWKAYGVTVLDGGETHSNYLYVVDTVGNLVETLLSESDAVDIAGDVRALLKGN